MLEVSIKVLNIEWMENYDFAYSALLYKTSFNPLLHDKISLVQIEGICRQKNKCNLNTEILLGWQENTVGKSRKCWLKIC